MQEVCAAPFYQYEMALLLILYVVQLTVIQYL